MKKVITCLLSLIFMLSAFSGVSAESVSAASPSQIVSETVEVLADGSRIVTTVYENISSVNPMATTYTKSGSKTRTGYNKDMEVMWTFTVNGTFKVVSGTSATCTAASYSHTAPGSGWSLKTASVSKSSNKAIGKATFIKKVLFITVDTMDTTCTLYCSTNGTLS